MKKEIVPSDSRYIPMTQQRWCCVPACFWMIMYRHGIPLVPQEELGYHLGLILPKDALANYWNARTGMKPPSGYGTRIFMPRYNPNKVFVKLDIPLKMIYHPINKFKDLHEFKMYLASIEPGGKDVIACFNYGVLHDGNYEGGHVMVIDRVSLADDEIRTIDPLYEMPKWQIHKISKLKEAMEAHGPNTMAGFWEIISYK
jgi:hypothetical protein